MSRKLAAKASLIRPPPAIETASAEAAAPGTEGQAGSASSTPGTPAAAAAARAAATGMQVHGAEDRPRTAPGSMASFMASQSAAIREVEELRLKLRGFDGARPMRALAASSIRPSRWANRHVDALADRDFQALKADIAAAGTNAQPICVRRAAAAEDRPDGGPQEAYEIVFGHRRHRACLELGLPVQAVVVDIDDRALFEAMERENRGRKNLSAWEQGVTYRRALDGGLYGSLRRLAEAIGVDVSIASKALALARLPEAVVAAFASPLDIQFRWAQPLGDALQRDPDGLVERAGAVRERNDRLTPKQVFEVLVGADARVLNRSTPTTDRRIGRAGHGAVLGRDEAGRAVLRFDAGVLTPERERELVQWLQASLGRRG